MMTYRGMRTEACVCGGAIRADLRTIAASVRTHQATVQHRAWRKARTA